MAVYVDKCVDQCVYPHTVLSAVKCVDKCMFNYGCIRHGVKYICI